MTSKTSNSEPSKAPSWPPYESFRSPNLFERNLVEIIIIIGGLIAINLIFIAKVYRETRTVDPATAGQLGDFVGGYIGTIFGLVSVVLLYSTLKNQRLSLSIQTFETKYFELIKMHRDNVDELTIGDDSGRKIFVMLIRELREIRKIAERTASELQIKYSNEQFMIISYYALLFGVGPNSSRMLLNALAAFDANFAIKFEKALNNPETKERIKSERKFKYIPFEGHQSRLGHYYRHLYQIITYVDKQKLEIDKYEFIKTIRAQLTTHEQALLFINSLTPIGSPWRTKTLVHRYRLVQNIPHSFFEPRTEIDIEKYFPADYFEWQERLMKNGGKETSTSMMN